MSRHHSARPGHTPDSRATFATVALGMGAAVVSAAAVLASGEGVLLAIGAYMLAGSASVAGLGLVQAARPLRPRLHRILALLRHPAAILTH